MSLTSSQIRSLFLEYFQKHQHAIITSSPLIPAGDNTLLFTNAGMVQFKDVFTGKEQRAYKRATTSQKIMRVSGKHNDLENVGPSPRHHTFFEMLGNFSFGDYFKKDAIEFAYDLLVNVYQLEPARMWATVFAGDEQVPADDDAAALWEQVGIPRERILKFGRKDNFWQMGDVGPCGPCSEIHYYRGPNPTDPKFNRSEYVNGDGEETIEIWNLVFMQFNRSQLPDGTYKLEPLPAPSVDTGAGLERVAAVLQNKNSNYETDLFVPILERTRELLRHDDATMQKNITHYRVIADHARAIAFLTADGILPGNEGRNYVLRLILRRAARHGQLLGFDGPFLTKILPTVIELMGEDYPELYKQREAILKTTQAEEERFQATLRAGSAMLDELIADLQKQKQNVIPGNAAFKLHDTYGFALEMTRDGAREAGMTVDEAGFRRAMDAQAERSRAASAIGVVDEKAEQIYREAKDQLIAAKRLPAAGVKYDPYSNTRVEASVTGIMRGGALVEWAKPDDDVEIILPATCFYVESGGQVSDTGRIVEKNGAWEIEVLDTRARVPGLIAHIGKVLRGTPRVGDIATAQVDAARRWDIMRNHTATHLLHYALRDVLGKHVQQAGSLVAPERLRFDFSHTAPLTPAEIARIEQIVNDAIFANNPVAPTEMAYKDALGTGAMALFTEKYGERVRVVQIGAPEEIFSRELCGGTHCGNTVQIGGMHIVSETSIGAGIRRIEAVTGAGLTRLAREGMNRLERVAASLKTMPEQVDSRVDALLSEMDAQKKEIEKLRREMAMQNIATLLQRVERVDGVNVLAAQVDAANVDMLREMTDWLREKMGSGIVVLGA
ncbi:MAG: alanine--tRNA ligase, partial [Chloroflexi bacterium]|nr:alanine--tRNA ligase [Chloroflexota bacterium]